MKVDEKVLRCSQVSINHIKRVYTKKGLPCIRTPLLPYNLVGLSQLVCHSPLDCHEIEDTYTIETQSGYSKKIKLPKKTCFMLTPLSRAGKVEDYYWNAISKFVDEARKELKELEDILMWV